MDTIPAFAPPLPVRQDRPLVTLVPPRAPKRLPNLPRRPMLGWLLLALSALALVCGASATLLG